MALVQGEHRVIMGAITKLVEQATASIEHCSEVSERQIWSRHGSCSIWRAERCVGSPQFYPIYRYGSYYSYSPLSLVFLKGSIHVNLRVAEMVLRPRFRYYSGKSTIDREVVRLGGPRTPRAIIKDANEYARRMADALRQDARCVEADHPGFTNIILCGGKDSLNLALLPWTNQVLLVSAPPNYDLVKRFVAEHGLTYDVLRLDDSDRSLLDLEILVNFCRNNLEHCRWGPHLKRLADSLQGKAIFWKGTLGDRLMTPKWKKVGAAPRSLGYPSRLFKLLRGRGQSQFDRVLEETRLLERYFFKVLWYKSAMWQGAHLSIIRQLTDALVLTGYHGPAVQRVVQNVDFRRAVQEDLRPLVGKYLLGTPVVYPATNPGPPRSVIRQGISHAEPLLNLLSRYGIGIHK